MDSPYFSVIIPFYNRETYLPRALVSLNCQTFQDFEVILVDDASTDRSVEVVRPFLNERTHLIRNDNNLERCTSRNKGIEAAKGNYIAFLDSDDYHLPNHLQVLHDFIQQKGNPQAFFFVNAFNESFDGVKTERNCPDFKKYSPYTYFLRYTVNPQRWAIHREIMRQHLFDPTINICEDMDVSLRMVSNNIPIFQINLNTTCYVSSTDSFTHGDPNKWERELDALQKIFQRSQLRGKLPLIERSRLISMCCYHLAVKAFVNNETVNFWRQALRSFFLYPKGYNGKTMKPLLVMMIYSIPFLGKVIKHIYRGAF